MKKMMFTCMPILLLSLAAGTCTKVGDSAARKKQVSNLAGNTVKNHFLQQLRQTKAAIDSAYRELYRVQDSIRQAGWDAATVRGLSWANLDVELSLWGATTRTFAAYTGFVAGEGLQGQATQVYNIANMRRADGSLPTTLQGYRALEQARWQLGLAFGEYAEKRALQMGQAFLRLARLLHLKSMEMDRLLKTDKAFSMGDAERLWTEEMCLDMMGKAYQLVERADQLSLGATAKGSAFKNRALAAERQRLLGAGLTATGTLKN